MDECQHAMEELRNIVEGISNLRDTAYIHYSLLIEQVLKDRITDEQQLEQIMDGLCDFCDEIRFIELYAKMLLGNHELMMMEALYYPPPEDEEWPEYYYLDAHRRSAETLGWLYFASAICRSFLSISGKPNQSKGSAVM